MNYNARLDLYNQIEAQRNRPLIVYVTSHRPNASALIAADTIPHFIKQIRCIDKSVREVDLLIVSYGGDPNVSWRIMSLLRERFDKVGVLLPYAAYSAATLMALGADEILMHPFANLGPTDPQLHTPRKGANGEMMQGQFGAEDLRHFFTFVRSEVGISDQEELIRAFELVCSEVGAVPIGIAQRSMHLTLSMGEKLLSMHLSDASKSKSVAEALNRSFFHHGYALGRSEAKEIGLPVIEPEVSLEELMWQVWESFEAEMKCGEPFQPHVEVLRSPQAGPLMQSVPMFAPPANLPPDVMQQVINTLLQQIPVHNIPPVPYELFLAAIEGPRCRSEIRSTGKILATRTPDMQLRINPVVDSNEWKHFNNQQNP